MTPILPVLTVFFRPPAVRWSGAVDRAPPRPAEDPRRQHAVRDLPGARPFLPAARDRGRRRDAGAPPEHGPAAPRADARGRSPRRPPGRQRRGRSAPEALFAQRRGTLARARAAGVPDAG